MQCAVSPAGLSNYCYLFTFVFFLISPVSPSHQCHRVGAALKKNGDVYFLMSLSHQCHREGAELKKPRCVFSDVTESPVSPAGIGNYCCFFTFVFFLMSPVSPSHQCHREGAALKKKWGCVIFAVTESPVSPRRG